MLFLITENPYFIAWEVTKEQEEITIHYRYGVSERSPKVHMIEWTKDGRKLGSNIEKYVGGGLHDSYLTITYPTKEDRGIYSCTISNAVGSVSKDVELGNIYYIKKMCV